MLLVAATTLTCAAGTLAVARMASSQEAAAALYVRGDSDETTVVTPRLRLGVPAGDDTRVGVVYMVDVWTSASIDIRTSASKAITEQRDEIDATVEHTVGDARFGASYRYSTEPDYESHGGTLGLDLDLADKSTTLGATLLATFDDVGRVGDPKFSRAARQFGARASLTQVLDRATLAQVIYEIGLSEGYLASPYRFVGIGGADHSCRGVVLYCIPESNPETRLKHALAARGRRGLDDRLSLGASYRFHLDDWDLVSHTAEADLAWLPVTDLSLALRYRFYTQGAAAHYRPRYPRLLAEALYTRDKELSPFDSHGAWLDLERAWTIDADGGSLRALLSAGPTFYVYRDYPLLDAITAVEVTLAVVLER
jgi:hypothetical protein